MRDFSTCQPVLNCYPLFTQCQLLRGGICASYFLESVSEALCARDVARSLSHSPPFSSDDAGAQGMGLTARGGVTRTVPVDTTLRCLTSLSLSLGLLPIFFFYLRILLCIDK